jgi:hypothetical protein
MFDEEQNVGRGLALLGFDEPFLQLKRGEIFHAAEVSVKKHDSRFVNFYRPSRVDSSSSQYGGDLTEKWGDSYSRRKFIGRFPCRKRPSIHPGSCVKISTAFSV